MTATVALPAEIKDDAKFIATLIVPAINGCNLRCPFCFIRQRKEKAESSILSSSDYRSFLEQIIAKVTLDAICIQGYEPLLPEAFDYTKGILGVAKKHNITSSLITNGTHLGERIEDLESLNPHTIFVSIDASTPEAHDRQRGITGAFDLAIEGLEVAAKSPTLRQRVAVTSVLISKKCHHLLGLPAILKQLGVTKWIVNPLIQVGQRKIGGFKAERSQIFQDALALKREADAYGIDFVVDDEFDTLSQEVESGVSIDINAHRFLSVQRLKRPGGVYRLMPNGQCSVGLQILQEVSPDTPRWVPGQMDAFEFIQSLGHQEEAA